MSADISSSLPAMGLAKLNNPLMQSTAGSHGYAVRNVNHRIKLICGEDYGISYESRKLLGTKVFVKIPVMTGE